MKSSLTTQRYIGRIDELEPTLDAPLLNPGTNYACDDRFCFYHQVSKLRAFDCHANGSRASWGTPSCIEFFMMGGYPRVVDAYRVRVLLLLYVRLFGTVTEVKKFFQGDAIHLPSPSRAGRNDWSHIIGKFVWIHFCMSAAGEKNSKLGWPWCISYLNHWYFFIMASFWR